MWNALHSASSSPFKCVCVRIQVPTHMTIYSRRYGAHHAQAYCSGPAMVGRRTFVVGEWRFRCWCGVKCKSSSWRSVMQTNCPVWNRIRQVLNNSVRAVLHDAARVRGYSTGHSRVCVFVSPFRSLQKLASGSERVHIIFFTFTESWSANADQSMPATRSQIHCFNSETRNMARSRLEVMQMHAMRIVTNAQRATRAHTNRNKIKKPWTIKPLRCYTIVYLLLFTRNIFFE